MDRYQRATTLNSTHKILTKPTVALQTFLNNYTLTGPSGCPLLRSREIVKIRTCKAKQLKSINMVKPIVVEDVRHAECNYVLFLG